MYRTEQACVFLKHVCERYRSTEIKMRLVSVFLCVSISKIFKKFTHPSNTQINYSHLIFIILGMKLITNNGEQSIISKQTLFINHNKTVLPTMSCAYWIEWWL